MGVTYTHATGVDVTVSIDSGTLLTLAAIADWPDFINRAKALAPIVSIALEGEDNTVTNSTARQAYAAAIVANPLQMALNAIPFLVADAVTDTTATDDALVNRWLAIANSLAG